MNNKTLLLGLLVSCLGLSQSALSQNQMEIGAANVAAEFSGFYLNPKKRTVLFPFNVESSIRYNDNDNDNSKGNKLDSMIYIDGDISLMRLPVFSTKDVRGRSMDVHSYNPDLRDPSVDVGIMVGEAVRETMVDLSGSLKTLYSIRPASLDLVFRTPINHSSKQLYAEVRLAPFIPVENTKDVLLNNAGDFIEEDDHIEKVLKQYCNDTPGCMIDIDEDRQGLYQTAISLECGIESKRSTFSVGFDYSKLSYQSQRSLMVATNDGSSQNLRSSDESLSMSSGTIAFDYKVLKNLTIGIYAKSYITKKTYDYAPSTPSHTYEYNPHVPGIPTLTTDEKIDADGMVSEGLDMPGVNEAMANAKKITADECGVKLTYNISGLGSQSNGNKFNTDRKRYLNKNMEWKRNKK